MLCRSITKREALFLDGSKGRLGDDQYRLATARAIHKNLVKVPEYCFDRIELCLAFSDYLHGKQSVGIVVASGAVKAKGLKSEIRIVYSNELGLVIESAPKKEGI